MPLRLNPALVSPAGVTAAYSALPADHSVELPEGAILHVRQGALPTGVTGTEVRAVTPLKIGNLNVEDTNVVMTANTDAYFGGYGGEYRQSNTYTLIEFRQAGALASAGVTVASIKRP